MVHHQRAPRKEVHEPATVRSDDGSYAAELRDISDTGAAIDFDLSSGGRRSFDIGNAVQLDMREANRQTGRVIRHYDGGFAMQFDGSK